MQIALIGKLSSHVELLWRACELSLLERRVDRMMVLDTEQKVRAQLKTWNHGASSSQDAPHTKDQKIVELGVNGTSQQIESYLETEGIAQRTSDIHALPDLHTRIIEVMDGEIVFFIHDKSVLNEDDIASTKLIVYGKGDTLDLRAFGSRHFFCPGPIADEKLSIIRSVKNGLIEIECLDFKGNTEWKKSLSPKTPRLSIT
ncbi:MAG: hypothetical protein IPJ88_15030 [Myxococcales bacterium]|nr:MAG: hypothetical protein IPJ88_15030 [Myxococcales bacterium]